MDDYQLLHKVPQQCAVNFKDTKTPNASMLELGGVHFAPEKPTRSKFILQNQPRYSLANSTARHALARTFSEGCGVEHQVDTKKLLREYKPFVNILYLMHQLCYKTQMHQLCYKTQINNRFCYKRYESLKLAYFWILIPPMFVVLMKTAVGTVQMRTIIGFENGGTNLGHLFDSPADQFSVAGALTPAQHI
ncbi:hypothetical protein LXL04_013833 [Taraxacum kok-saghyz]